MEKDYHLTQDYCIHRVINGCWQLSDGHTIQGELDFQDVMNAFHQLTQRGFTTFDCGDIYTGVEEFIGKFVQELKDGKGVDYETIHVDTKYVPDLDCLETVSFEDTRRIVERSIKRLNKGSLDLVQYHWWDYEIKRCVEVANHLVELQKEGLIKHIGVTNFDTEHLKELVDAGIPVVSCQSQYSLFDRRVEKQLLPYCIEHNISLLCYGTLAGGFLSEKWIGVNRPENPETRSQVKYLQVIDDSLGWDGFQQLLVLLKEIADHYSVNISQVASQYILNQPGVGAVIVGVRNSRHIDDNARIFEFDLSDKDMKTIKDFLNQYPTLEGEPFELERTIGSKYRNIMWMNLNE